VSALNALYIGTHALFVLAIGFYLITSLQWFSYKFERIAFHYTKYSWHVCFLALPYLGYWALVVLHKIAFIGAFYVIFVPALWLWHRRLDKPLVFTARVKRFFGILALCIALFDLIFVPRVPMLPVILPLAVAFCLWYACERFVAHSYRRKALAKLDGMSDLLIIQITASFGKTSIKNYLYSLLCEQFRCYKTPRSVNTLVGIIQDINNDLPADTQIYIAESGARLAGDIAEITQFLRPHYVIVGEVGEQHIEYFKSIENIRATKLEALESPRLCHAWVHSTTGRAADEKIEIYNMLVSDINADLKGVNFSLNLSDYNINSDNKNGQDIVKFSAPILGKFNAENLAVCVLCALYLGVNIEQIRDALSRLQNPEHRLSRIVQGGKLIIDDSFNGNLAGMLASYELARTHPGRKVIITPGIVESTREQNEALARAINDIFDLVIVTGELNRAVFESIIDEHRLIILRDKSELVATLGGATKSGDLVLFSNDAPSFI